MTNQLVTKKESFSFDEPLPQNILNIEAKKRVNLFPWRGQFSPQLVEALLCAYAPQYSNVLDPFVGSGTTLHEAAKLGLSATGFEINPAAIVFAKIFEFSNIPKGERERVINEVEVLLSRSLLVDFPLINSNIFSCAEINEFVDKARHGADKNTRNLVDALFMGIDFGKFNEVSCEFIMNGWMKLRKIVSDLPLAEGRIQAREIGRAHV